MSLQDDRKEYLNGELGDESLSANPREMFLAWLEEYRLLGNSDSTAFALSTVSKDGTPDSRIVLLKEIRDEGFVFYTNYNSKKGRDISNNPNVHALFFWPEIERQIRIKGKVKKISRIDSEKYFSSRPKLSQLGALSSNQSEKIKSRIDLELKFNSFKSESSNDYDCPDDWGGYYLSFEKIEFWQGRRSRMHDRLVFEIKSNSEWNSFRVQP
ncbi:MAG: pyridoxamine 5'-phosphate oxidase [Schleiferiaceae bacterium]|nr:pyridoxamine 5'-phosphate oxidase [Schleiferiaceae bacterium]